MRQRFARPFLSKGRTYALERIDHMLGAAEAILMYAARGREAFENDQTIRDAIQYQIIVIGEAAKAVIAADPTILTEIPGIEWSPWAKMRDRITHQYWSTESEIVWQTAVDDVPELHQKLTEAIQRLSDRKSPT